MLHGEFVLFDRMRWADHIYRPQFKKEHSWLYQSGDPEDPVVRVSQVCREKNIFVCPKMDESARNTAAWAVQMILVSIAMAEHRARLAFQEHNGTLNMNTMHLGVERLDLGRSSSMTQAEGQKRSEILDNRQDSGTSRLSIDCRGKTEETLDGRASRTLGPHESSDPNSWMDDFIVRA
jgi:hypothetical protein